VPLNGIKTTRLMIGGLPQVVRQCGPCMWLVGQLSLPTITQCSCCLLAGCLFHTTSVAGGRVSWDHAECGGVDVQGLESVVRA
jgi:hypothetical protein